MISLRASVEPTRSILRSFSPLSTVKSVHCRATAEKSIDPQARRYICRRNIDDASGLVWSSVRPPPPTPESPTQLPALSWLRRMLTACTDELVEVIVLGRLLSDARVGVCSSRTMPDQYHTYTHREPVVGTTTKSIQRQRHATDH